LSEEQLRCGSGHAAPPVASTLPPENPNDLSDDDAVFLFGTLLACLTKIKEAKPGACKHNKLRSASRNTT